ncbi:predicted protein [Scheffersomyces stipitis CBS 6054]|uniref:BZIP domain-containing protein n=1 Tax=Scheffersomyces stipitis (strain ATCC 58785 / CBS 6054 / NBRC 10063 / NRRL Y-11545) TaxID=322104 RepID=A3LSF0_PICST|nr:predicted protein [Scheffersomyces stipitis CBS 6054]ABN65892.1 predicted protein [Scheffersomyces stipitis CBS 6054]
MNLHPTDYLNNLNLDFDSVVSPNLSEYNSQQLQNELDIFSQSDFFDLDVLSADNVVPIKQKVQFQEQQQQQQQQPSVVVKTEDDIALSFLNLPSEGNGAFPEEKLVAQGAASEDKRKRNTAASARFRIKKKLKEQEMEQKSKELQDRLLALEKKLKTLEMENKCLKNLILEQNEKKNTDLLESIKKRSILDSKPVFQFTS